jgi:uncharacterized membrane protein
MVQLLFYLIILLITLIMSTEKEIKNKATVVASAEQTANAEVQTPKKRRGRGINNDLRDVTRKKFDELIYRYNNVNCSQSKLKVHKLYIAGTIEEASLKKEKLSANHEVIQNVNSDISAQNFDDIIC